MSALYLLSDGEWRTAPYAHASHGALADAGIDANEILPQLYQGAKPPEGTALRDAVRRARPLREGDSGCRPIFRHHRTEVSA